jgi:transcriptional regulator with XRE-family HTH domain
MTRVLHSPEYIRLRQELVAAREAAGLTQIQLAEKLTRTQSFVSKYELGERRLDVVEFVLVCRCIGVAPSKILARISL